MSRFQMSRFRFARRVSSRSGKLIPALVLGACLSPCLSLGMAGGAQAETRIFLIDSSNTYGVDSCLSSGESCGAQIAAAWCRSHDYARALDFGPVDRNGPAIQLSGTTAPACRADEECPAVVAITCSR